MIFMPESPRFLMHKDRTLESYNVWRRIRGTDRESAEEFFVMKHSVEEERNARLNSPTGRKRFVWLDFFTNPRARRAVIYGSCFPLPCSPRRAPANCHAANISRQHICPLPRPSCAIVPWQS